MNAGLFYLNALGRQRACEDIADGLRTLVREYGFDLADVAGALEEAVNEALPDDAEVVVEVNWR